MKMKKKMAKKKRKPTKYVTVKIPEGLAKKIDQMLKWDTSYTSRTDLIKDGVRRMYREMRQFHQKKKK